MRSSKLVSVALVVSLVSFPLSETRADDAPAAAKAEAAFAIQPGDLGGNILGLDGKTPVKGALIQLLDKDGKVVAEASTDENGVFKLGKQSQGEFQLKIGKASGKLVVKDGAQAKSLKFLLDQDVALGAQKAAATKIAAISTTGAVLIGVGFAIVGLGAGIGIGYAVWGTRSEKKVFVPVATSP